MFVGLVKSCYVIVQKRYTKKEWGVSFIKVVLKLVGVQKWYTKKELGTFKNPFLNFEIGWEGPFHGCGTFIGVTYKIYIKCRVS